MSRLDEILNNAQQEKERIFAGTNQGSSKAPVKKSEELKRTISNEQNKSEDRSRKGSAERHKTADSEERSRQGKTTSERLKSRVKRTNSKDSLTLKDRKKTVRNSSRTTVRKASSDQKVKRTSQKNVMNKVSSGAKKAEGAKNILAKLGQIVAGDFGIERIKKAPHILMFPLVFVYFEIILRICTGTSVFAHIIYPVLFGVATGLFVTFITLLFKRNINRIISIIILFATGFIFIVECLVKRSFQWYMPISGILSGAGGVAGNYMSEAVNAIIGGIPAMILFFMPGIAYILIGKTYLPAKRFKVTKAMHYLAYAAVIMVIAIGVANVGSSATKYKKQYKFDTATEYFGLLTSLRLETKYGILGNNAATGFVLADEEVKETEEAAVKEPVVYGKNEMDIDFAAIDKSTNNEEIKELNAYVQSLKPSSQNEYTGLFEGKNLIMICAEAFSDVVIDKELTPTLYRLTHNGFYFSDFYQPTWGGSTTSGEAAFVLGFVPMWTDESMTITQNNNNYFTMGNQLQRLGYKSAAYHAGDYDFYDRNLTHENLGYTEFWGGGGGLEEYVDWYGGDNELFDVTLDTFMDQEPFSIYYMTLSGHCVYIEDKWLTQEYIDEVRDKLGDTYKDTTTYYICYQMELEKALTTMIQKLEVAGIADDTVICLTSDHYPYGLENTSTFGNYEDYVSDLYGHEIETSWDQDHNTWILWSGCLENEYKDMACEISEPTYSLDILPTLSNLFGLEFDSRFMVGRDVFSDAEPLVLWNGYSWKTDKGSYDSSTDEFIPNEGVEVDDSYVDRIHTLVSNKISYSINAVENDYFGVLFGEDTVKGETAANWAALAKPEETETEEVEETETEE